MKATPESGQKTVRCKPIMLENVGGKVTIPRTFATALLSAGLEETTTDGTSCVTAKEGYLFTMYPHEFVPSIGGKVTMKAIGAKTVEIRRKMGTVFFVRALDADGNQVLPKISNAETVDNHPVKGTAEVKAMQSTPKK